MNVRPGAAAHMSLHLNQQCQRAKNTDARSYPLLPGLAGHPCFLRPPQEPVWRPAAVRWPICSTPIRVNILFALLLQSAEKMAEICASQQVWTGFSPPIRPFRRAISASKFGGFSGPRRAPEQVPFGQIFRRLRPKHGGPDHLIPSPGALEHTRICPPATVDMRTHNQ